MSSAALAAPGSGVHLTSPARRPAGWLTVAGLIGSPGMIGLALAMTLIADKSARDVAGYVVQAVYLLGWMATAVALRRRRATGDTRGARVAFVVQIVGLALALAFSTLESFGPSSDALPYRIAMGITDACWPLSHLFMLVIGTLIARGGVFAGWRRTPAFLVGAALPLGMLPRAFHGPEVLTGVLFGGLTMLGHLGLAWAARQNQKEDRESRKRL